jgi:serine/threonine-protein kinase
VAFLDGIGVPLPGGVDALLLALAAIDHDSAYLCAVLATAGSRVGSIILFRIARRGGEKYLERYTSRGRGAKFKRWFAAAAAAAFVGAAAWGWLLPQETTPGDTPPSVARASRPVDVGAPAVPAAAEAPPVRGETDTSPDATPAVPTAVAPAAMQLAAATPPTKPTAKVRKKAAGTAAPVEAAARSTPPLAAAAPAKGTVQIAISPWGRVEVDGTVVGVAPPLTRIELPRGTHTITVRNEDFPVFTREVTVDPEQPVSLKHRFGS